MMPNLYEESSTRYCAPNCALTVYPTVYLFVYPTVHLCFFLVHFLVQYLNITVSYYFNLFPCTLSLIICFISPDFGYLSVIFT